MSKGTHKTKDGRTAKKGLYYYMNRAKKRGTSKPGKGTVTDEALARSKKTAKKAKMGGTAMKKEMMYKDGGKSEFGMLSVKAGYDNNPNPTAADRIVGAKKDKKKMGGSKQQAAIAINMKKEGKMPKDKMGMGGMMSKDMMEKEKMMKKGGKKKMYGGMGKKKKMYGGKKKMMGGGPMMKKKMMYETGGFLEPGIPNLDDCCN